MKSEIEKLWESFCSENKDFNSTQILRKGSNFKKASPWVFGRASPTQPVKMLSMKNIYSGWANPNGIEMAKEFLRSSPNLTLRELGERMLKSGKSFPYIWWCFAAEAPEKRVIYEDSEGVNFVKLHNKWQIAYSVLSSGILVGAQGGKHYEDLLQNAYFVLWENEDAARRHT